MVCNFFCAAPCSRSGRTQADSSITEQEDLSITEISQCLRKKTRKREKSYRRITNFQFNAMIEEDEEELQSRGLWHLLDYSGWLAFACIWIKGTTRGLYSLVRPQGDKTEVWITNWLSSETRNMARKIFNAIPKKRDKDPYRFRYLILQSHCWCRNNNNPYNPICRTKTEW